MAVLVKLKAINNPARAFFLGGSNMQTGGAVSMIESIERMVAIMQAMHKEHQAQNELVMQRISGMEEQLRDSKDDVREMQEQIRGVNTRIDNVTMYMEIIIVLELARQM
jgi:TolA-binding protein